MRATLPAGVSPRSVAERELTADCRRRGTSAQEGQSRRTHPKPPRGERAEAERSKASTEQPARPATDTEARSAGGRPRQQPPRSVAERETHHDTTRVGLHRLLGFSLHMFKTLKPKISTWVKVLYMCIRDPGIGVSRSTCLAT